MILLIIYLGTIILGIVESKFYKDRDFFFASLIPVIGTIFVLSLPIISFIINSISMGIYNTKFKSFIKWLEK